MKHMKGNKMVKFSKANAKIEALQEVPSLQPYLKGKKVYSFDKYLISLKEF